MFVPSYYLESWVGAQIVRGGVIEIRGLVVKSAKTCCQGDEEEMSYAQTRGASLSNKLAGQ